MNDMNKAAVGTSGVTVSEALSKQDRKAFLDLPYEAYRDVPHWRAPLRFERKAQIDPLQNPGLAVNDHILMLARRDGQVVGRIAAIVNKAHLDLYQDDTGHFGFLDTLAPDPEAIAALMAAAEEWLRARGMKRIMGPFNFTINEETGLLVEGFDSPPMLMMPHGRPDYAPALTEQGFVKAMDMHAYSYTFDDTYERPARSTRLVQAFERESALSIRPMNMKKFKEDIALVMDIFNDAWSENWGFIPFSQQQISAMSQELKPLLRSDSLFIAMINDEPVGFTLFLPDLNEIVHGLDGRMLPFGWAKLVYRLKIRGPRRARLPLAGLRRKYHKTQPGLVAMAGCFDAGFMAQRAQGVRQIEASWVLEDNKDLISLINLYDMDRYKTYRVYEKPL